MTPGPGSGPGSFAGSEPVLLSVVVAAYDAAGTLPAQLAALAAQRPAWPWEVVVADNGSRDATRDVVTAWQDPLPELRLVDASARRGPAAARNLGVAASRGRWIAFCDADDVVGDGWVQAVHDGLAAHPFVAGRFDVERLRGANPFQVSWSPQLDGLTTLTWLPELVTAGAGNLALHREVFDAVGGFDEGALTAEDDDLCLRAQLAGFPLAYVPDMVLHVRRRAGLRAVLRQALSYGAGARRLEHRFALVAEARAHESGHTAERGAATEQEPTTTEPEPRAAAAPAPAAAPRSTAARLRRVAHPSRMANAAWRLGWALGYRRAEVSHVPQVAPAPAARPGASRP